MKFSWDKVKRPILALAPMEGYTDSVFRQIIKKYAPNVVCFTELTSSEGLKYKNKTSFKKVKFAKEEQPLIVQLFGKNPENFVEAAKYIEETGAAGIDINMGCPAKNVIASKQGSVLIKKPDLAAEIVHSLSKNIKLPVSVKTRLGYSSYNKKKFESFCLKLQQAGAKLITIHGRTKKHGFKGNADWQPIYEIKEKLKIPVIGNGDIKTVESALNKLKNLDGIMVGRATFGNPLIMHHIYKALHPRDRFNKRLPGLYSLIKMHLDLSIKMEGEKNGIRSAKKHLLAYTKGLPHSTILRNKLSKAKTKDKILKIFDSI